MELQKIIDDLQQECPSGSFQHSILTPGECEIYTQPESLVKICGAIFASCGLCFAGIVVEEARSEWLLRYSFYGRDPINWIHIILCRPIDAPFVPSIVECVHAADWHEREAEDLFGLKFEGHPRLGNFVLHDEVWEENVEPMRHSFNLENTQKLSRKRRPTTRRIVQEAGSFAFPIGPKYSGVAESAYFLLETVGEDVVRSQPRLFYKWRAVEKIAEGKTVDEALILAERFAADTAFAHGLAFCQAVEKVGCCSVPRRAKLLRIFAAELERFRHHAGAIQEICESTALNIAGSQAAIIEEDLLRTAGGLTGHRYLFGLLAPGGLNCDLPDTACKQALQRTFKALKDLQDLSKRLRNTSSFLDRLENVGAIDSSLAKIYNLQGPVARASGAPNDLRQVLPYGDYRQMDFEVPCEKEGDGYARLRILFEEAAQSVKIMEQAAGLLTPGEVRSSFEARPGAAFGWSEAPRGASFQWVRLADGGRIARYGCLPPSFANWHGFHIAVEKFAFQDFPIILSTMILSVAENDR